MIDLPTLYPSLAESIANLLSALITDPPSRRGEICEGLCECYRTSAIGALLLEMDSDQFHHMLIRSALTRIYLLERTDRDEVGTSRYCKITRTNGFFDALAGNRFDLAQRIVSLSPAAWNSKYEYEDDYCYALFLHEMVRGADRARKEEILARFAQVLDGEPSTRKNVCEALLDGEGFEDAFEDLLLTWASEIRLQERSISRDEIVFAGARHIFVEGLALLRIAEASGIKVQPEYRFCPREARLPMQAPFPDDGYPK